MLVVCSYLTLISALWLWLSLVSSFLFVELQFRCDRTISCHYKNTSGMAFFQGDLTDSKKTVHYKPVITAAEAMSLCPSTFPSSEAHHTNVHHENVCGSEPEKRLACMIEPFIV